MALPGHAKVGTEAAGLTPERVATPTSASATVAAPTAVATSMTAATAVAIDAPKGILASGQIHKRTTPAIALTDEPELPFYFKSWLFALLLVLITLAIKRPWSKSRARSSEQRPNRSSGLVAPFVRS